MTIDPQTKTGGNLILEVENISLSFGAVRAIVDVSFSVIEGEVLAIIGPNGAGKTSMLNVINGFITRKKVRFSSVVRSAVRCVHIKRLEGALRVLSRMLRCSRA